jgi:hypothetical protein
MHAGGKQPGLLVFSFYSVFEDAHCPIRKPVLQLSGPFVCKPLVAMVQEQSTINPTPIRLPTDAGTHGSINMLDQIRPLSKVEKNIFPSSLCF